MLTTLLLALAPLGALATPAPRQNTTDANYWFSFGDSYTQTWFNSSGELPSASNPLGNPTYPGWTASGGENWVGLLTTKYNNSFLLTYNYAYGGATINASLVEPYEPTVHSLIDQVDDYVSGAGEKPDSTPWTSENALFSVWIGINDIGNSWYKEGDRDEFSEVLLDGEFGQVERLYDTGARNFLFVNVPPVDRSPAMLLTADDWSRDKENSVIQAFNMKLQAKVDEFAGSHEGVTTFFYDSWTDFTRILDDPEAYGFTTNETAYGNSPEMFWGNDYHPSSYAYEVMMPTIADVLSDTIW